MMSSDSALNNNRPASSVSGGESDLKFPGGYFLSLGETGIRIPVEGLFKQSEEQNWVPICDNDFHLNKDDPCPLCDECKRSSDVVPSSDSYLDSDPHYTSDISCQTRTGFACPHRGCFSVCSSYRFCSFCLFLFNIDKFYKRNKYFLTRRSLSRLAHCSVEELLSLSILFTSNTRIDAEVVASHRVSCEYVKLLSTNVRLSSQTPFASCDWIVCDNVEHLFECFSISDSDRGYIIGRNDENAYWNASCSRCDACCQGTNARTAIPVILLMRFLTIRKEGNIWLASHIHDADDFVEINERTAQLIGRVNNIVEPGCFQTQGSKNSLETKVILDESRLTHMDWTIKHPKCDPLCEESCDHQLVIRNQYGVELPLNRSMFLTFMALSTYHGRMSSEDGEINAVVSYGGLIGVNIMCNKAFMKMHANFYSGTFRVKNSNLCESVRIYDCVAQSGFNDEEFRRLMEEEDDAEVKSVSNWVSEYLETEDVIDIVEEAEPSKTRGLSLNQALGGLLKGVSHCVDSLHKVFDWPIDLAIDAAKGTAAWLEDNKMAVDDSKICAGCPEIQKDMQDFQKETKTGMELLRDSIKKLSEGIDKITKMNQTNFERIVNRLKPIESKLSELEKFKAESSNNKDGEAVKQLVQAIKDIKTIKEALLNLNDRVKDLEEGKSGPVDVEKPGDGIAGEQQPIPKLNKIRAKAVQVKKQSGTTIVNNEIEQGFDVKEKEVVDPNISDMYNAVKSEYLVKSFTWKVSDGQDKVLSNVSIPEDLWNTNSRLNDIMSYFQYYKATGLTFRISTTCIPTHGGTLFAAWDACGCATRQGIATAVQLTGLPGTIIEAHSSSLTTFSVDDPLTQSTVCLSGSEHSFGRIGILKICCLNVLNAPQAATQSVSVNVWVKFDGVKFHFYSLKKQPVVSQMFVDKLTDLGELGCVVATGTWSTTSSSNLLQLNVHPTACSIGDGLITQTPLSIVAHAFSRWRGTLKFTITFGASMFTRGRVLVAAIPVAKRKDSLTIDEISGYHNVMCLLNGERTTFELEVPYYSIGEDSFVCRDALFDVSSYAQNFMITRLHMVVIDSLVMSSNASNTISYCVMMGPGKDLEFRYLSGIHAQRNVRELIANVSLGFSLHSGKNIGLGFSDLLKRWSHLLTLNFDMKSEEDDKLIGSYIITVAPSYRSFPQHNTLLSWFSQLFVQWQGGLCYRLHTDSQERRWGGYIRIWHDPNGSLDEGVEFAISRNLEPPPGAFVRYWNYNEQSEIEFVVPFTARTSRLFVPKAMIATDSKSWILNYNGTLNLDFRGVDDLNVTVDICAADNFEFSVRTVAPKAGKVNDSFTKLSYNDKLVDIKKPLTAAGRLDGPFNLNKIVAAVPKTTPSEKTGDIREEKTKSARSERNNAFNALVNSVAQMETFNSDANGCFSFGNIRSTAKLLNERKTCEKLADIMDFTHETLGVSGGPSAQRLAEAVAQIAPIIESVGRTTASVESKITALDKYKGKVMKILECLSRESIPGLAVAEFKKGKYMWAALMTMIAGAALVWACTSKKSFLKRFSIVAMIIWSPFLAGKVWSLGQWIINKWSHLWPQSDSCRQHSLAGLFENVKMKVKAFPDWFQSGGISVVTQVCTVLLTIVSLITLGTIPSAKKSKSMAERFTEFGNMNRAVTSISAGYKSVSEICSKFTSFIATTFLGATIDDSVFKDLVSFDVKKWVAEVKEASLEENKFKAFGTDKHLTKVRHMYDRSVEITKKLLDKNRVPVPMLPIIRDTCKKCEELLNDSYSYKGMKSPRIDPFYICLTGPPGVGKSTVASIIINELLDHMGEPKVDRIYTRCCADSYWSNYHHEPVIIYDDLGAISKMASLSDYAEIMGIKSNRPYALPMAAVEEKGRHCLSRYLVACTNLTHLDDTGDVKTKEAYYRRINLPVTVERDNSVPMSPTDPSAGLVFTIGDICENGRYVSVVESRLLAGRVPFRAGDLRNMTYSYFMEFLKIYAVIYMENQQLLVSKLSGEDEETPTNSSDYEENDELEFNFLATSQAACYVSVEEIVAKFNSLQLRGKDLNAEIERVGALGVSGWQTKKVLSFDELVRRFCGCNAGEDCNFEFWYQKYHRELMNARKVPAYKCMVLHKPNKERMQTQVKLVNGHTLESMFKTLEPMTIFLYLVFLVKVGLSNDSVCLSYRMLISDHVEETDYDVEDAMCLSKKVMIGQHECYVWPKIGEFYPDILAKRACVAVNDGTNFYIFVSSDKIPSIDPEGAWTDLLQGIGRKRVGIMHLAGPSKTQFLIPHVEECYKALKDQFIWKERCNEYRDSLSLHEYLLVLLAVGSKAGAETRKMNKPSAKRLNLNMSKIYEDYLKQEERVLGKISKPAKACLAVGAGVAIFGVLAGIGFGLYKVISQFTQPQSSEEDDVVYDELVPEMSGSHESSGITTRFTMRRQPPKIRLHKQRRSSPITTDIECDDLVPEMSGAHVSDEHVTRHLTRRRIVTREKRERAKAELSGCHESDEHKTRRFQRKRIPMKRTALTRESYVVTYDEHTPYVKVIRRLRRNRLAKAIKQMACQEDFPDTLAEIHTWQKFVVEEKGVRQSKHTTDPRVFSALMVDEIEDPDNVNMASGDTMTFDEEKYNQTVERVSAIMPGKTELQKMVKDGPHHTAIKQIRVNYKSLDKDPNMVSLLSNSLAKISCVVLNMTPGRCAYLNVMRLCGTFVVCPAHYLEALEEDDELYFISFSICIKFRFQADRVTLVNTHQDLIVWDLGNTIPPGINVIDQIPTIADWDRYQDGPGAFGVTKYNARFPTNYINTLDMIERIRADTQNPTGIYKMLNSDHTITTGLRYQMYSLEGFCGGLIVRASTKMVRKIVGIHVAASSNHAMGYAECLVQEDLRHAIASLAPDARNTVIGHLVPKVDVAMMQCGLERSLGSLGCHGKVRAEDIAMTSTKTTVRKSRIYGLIGEVKTEPSILHSQDPRLPPGLRGSWDPVFEAALKYGSRIDPFPYDEILEVEEHLTNMLSKMENSLTKRNVNNLEIGINGIDQSDYWLQIETNTSPGWPYTKRKPKGAEGKKWLFREVGNYPSGKPILEMDDEGLIDSYESMLKEAKAGIAPRVVTVECPKDERRKLNKIYDNPATRTFTILPPEINILFRQYFGDFAAMVMTNRAKLFCQVGINPENMEWSDLMHGFLSKSSKGFAGDYSKFDGIGDPQIYHSITQVVNNWYNDGEENARTRHALISSIIHREGIVKEYLFQYCQGMPSGFAMTVIFNSFVNYYYLAMAWMNLISSSPLSPQSTLRDFDEYCKVVVYGDDNIVSVSEEFIPYYNLRMVAAYLSQFGVTYTDDAKNPIEKSVPWVDIRTVSFLKRRWTSIGGQLSTIYKAPLETTSIEERLHWIRECDDDIEALNQNIESALYEASIHGPIYFGNLKARIDEACDAVMIPESTTTYKDCQRRWWTSMTGGSLDPSQLSRLIRLADSGRVDVRKVWKDRFLGEEKTITDLLKTARAVPLATYHV
uniref:Genome polyprotein n=1 Tax=Maize chlorotic dwarf virus TaxID=51354 RepID=Q5MH31_9SECO|nr:polyprotein [Maize chlorotic dwarf virus]